jgi:hypothetical protein
MQLKFKNAFYFKNSLTSIIFERNKDQITRGIFHFLSTNRPKIAIIHTIFGLILL